jgi:tetratricopeptide (TPR) repeat protein
VGTLLEDKDRNVIPRLRSFRTTLALGELDSAGGPAESEWINDEESLENKIRAWKENGTVSFAADLASAALVLQQPHQAKEAAHFLLSKESRATAAARAVAQRILASREDSAQPEALIADLSLPNAGQISEWIRLMRRRLHDEPRNAILWVELSRAYVHVGLVEKAERAMDIAVALGPTNRFILRSASRLYVHVGKLGKAHYVLERAESTKYDPWLLSAEIAAASAASRNSQLVKTGQKILLDDSISPFQKNELASAIGTVELSHGKVKIGRNLFRQALIDPTENTIAQLGWALRKRYVDSLGLDLEKIKNETPRSFEARAWGNFTKCKWKEALHASFDWVRDQPFSTRPVFFASFVAASLLEDYRSCERIIEIGLRANPDEPMLLNDLAFAFASSGQIDKAEQTFLRIDSAQITDVSREIVIMATQGLINFRRGIPAVGRGLYQTAIEKARRHRLYRTSAIASIYWAREEVLSKSEMADKATQLAVQERDRVSDWDINHIFEIALGGDVSTAQHEAQKT